MISKEQKVVTASSINIDVLASILHDAKSPITNIIGDTEYATIINAITLETESTYFNRILKLISDLKNGSTEMYE